MSTYEATLEANRAANALRDALPLSAPSTRRRTCMQCWHTYVAPMHGRNVGTPHARDCTGCDDSSDSICSACYLHPEHDGWKPYSPDAEPDLDLFTAMGVSA